MNKILLICVLNVCYYAVSSFMFTNYRSTTTMTISMPEFSSKFKFDLGKIAFSLIPLTPESAGRRKTLLKEVVKDKVWTLDQLQGIINVNGQNYLQLAAFTFFYFTMRNYLHMSLALYRYYSTSPFNNSST